MSRTIQQMSEEVVKSFDSYEAQGTKKWDWKSAAKDLSYQVGSVTKIMQQMTNERWAEGKTDNDLMAEMTDELSDVIACALFVAAKLNIDIDQAWEQMLQSDKKKISERT